MADQKKVKRIEDLFFGEKQLDEGTHIIVIGNIKHNSGYYDPKLSDKKFLCLRSEAIERWGMITMGMGNIGYTPSGTESRIPYGEIRKIKLIPLKKDHIVEFDFENQKIYNF